MAGFIFDEKSFVNTNVLLHEERMGSQLTRFLDKSPNFVTYYHINGNETTVDSGLLTVERILGDNSPVKFNKINDLPIYGIESIVLQLETDGVLDGSYDDGEAIILPNTIEPLPNDFFIFNYLDSRFIFMVTNVAYDTIKSNNFYRISFSLKSIDDEKLEDLSKQTSDEYQCISGNIGTEDRVFIESNEYIILKNLETVYRDITEHYKQLFYNSRYNKFLYVNENGTKLYDPYSTHFIFRHALFQEKNTYDTIYLKAERNNPQFYHEYDKSIYSALEKNDETVLSLNKYTLYAVTDLQSVFKYYNDMTVRTVRLETDNGDVYPPELLQTEEFSYTTLVDKHFGKSIERISDLNVSELSRYYTWMSYSLEGLLYVPMILFILRYHYNKFMKQ